jgi:hypothetical protein
MRLPRSRTWTPHIAAIYCSTDLPLRVWHATENQPGTDGILTCYLTGSPMREVQSLSPEALLEVLLGELEPVISPWQDTLERVVTTDCMGDAYAGGGWIVSPVPSNDDLRVSLIQPHGSCFFAGEHLASACGAIMEGALRHEIISDVGVPHVIWRHTPSLRAADNQAVLDAMPVNMRVWANKTLTIRLGPMHLLCTGVGNFTLNRSLLSAVAHELRLPKRIVKDCHIIPADYSPEYELGLLTGMVSPFLSPALSAHRLHAVALLTETDVRGEQRPRMVAVSVSPFESLLVPLVQFRILAKMYARRVYPALRWLEIDRLAATQGAIEGAVAIST